MTDWGGVKPEDVTFYYTTDERYRDATDVTGTDFGDSSVWTAFSLTDNAWKPDEQTKQITAIAYKCTIPGKSTIQMHITLRLPDGEPGDVVHGRLMLDSLSSGDRSQIVTRNLEGLVWMDYNADGIRNDGAIDYVFGVKVELLKLRDGCEGLKDKVESYESVCYPGTKIPVSISTGQQVSYRKGNPENVQHQSRGYYRKSKHEDEAGKRGRLGGFHRIRGDCHAPKAIQGFPVRSGSKAGFRVGAESRGRKAAGTRFRRKFGQIRCGRV